MIYIVVETCKYEGLQMLSPEKGWEGPRVYYTTRYAAELVVARLTKEQAEEEDPDGYPTSISYRVLEITGA